MITLKLSRDKIISMVKITRGMIEHVEGLRDKLSYNLLRAELNSHIYILKKLKLQFEIKYLQVQNKPGDRPVQLSIDEVHAYVIIHYHYSHPVRIDDAYELATLQEISTPIYKHLLAA